MNAPARGHTHSRRFASQGSFPAYRGFAKTLQPLGLPTIELHPKRYEEPHTARTTFLFCTHHATRTNRLWRTGVSRGRSNPGHPAPSPSATRAIRRKVTSPIIHFRRILPM